MNPDDFPAPKDGFVVTQFLVVSDQERSRDFYQSVFGAKVVLERDPVILNARQHVADPQHRRRPHR